MRFYAAMMIVTAIALTNVNDLSTNRVDNSYDVFNVMLSSALWPMTMLIAFSEMDLENG